MAEKVVSTRNFTSLPFRIRYVSYLKKEMDTTVVDGAPMTAEAYLEAERKGSREEYGKFEYYNGELIEMGGASKEHNRISLNLSGLFWQAFLDKPHDVFHSDMRTYAPQTNSYFYPDLVVSNGEAQFKDDGFDNLTNPVLIVEVLSASASSNDRGVKFASYRSIETFSEYLLVASQNELVEYYQRQRQNEWKLVIYQNDEDTFSLLDDKITLSVADIYRNVKVS